MLNKHVINTLLYIARYSMIITVNLFISVLEVYILYTIHIYTYYKLSSYNIWASSITWLKHFRSCLIHPINPCRYMMCSVDFFCSQLDDFLLRDINTHAYTHDINIMYTIHMLYTWLIVPKKIRKKIDYGGKFNASLIQIALGGSFGF